MKNHIMYVLGIIAIIMSILFLSLVFIVAVYPFSPITINSVKMITTEAEVGGIAIWELDYCKHMAHPATVTKILVDHHIIPYPSFTTNVNTGCSKNNVTLHIPDYAEVGEYYVKTSFLYEHIYGMRNVEVVYRTPTFNITGNCEDDTNGTGRTDRGNQEDTNLLQETK